MGSKSLNEQNGAQFRMDLADEQLDVTTRAFMGLSVACARCHDHKFDPIRQSDYYALAVFLNTETSSAHLLQSLERSVPSPIETAVPHRFTSGCTEPV